MKQVVLDAATRAKLNGLTSQLEVVDEQGNLLGHFMPLDVDLQTVSLPGPDPLSDQDFARTYDPKDQGRPLADILRDLRNR
jgi:hypothetical protein